MQAESLQQAARTPRSPGQVSNAETDDSWVSTDEEGEPAEDGWYHRGRLPQMHDHLFQRAEDGMSDLSNITKRYNTWASILGNSAASSRPWIRGNRALKTKNEIDALLRQLAPKVVSLKRDVQQFSLITSEVPHEQWYRMIEDITDLDPVELGVALNGGVHHWDMSDTMEEIDIHDLDDFVDYLLETLPRNKEVHPFPGLTVTDDQDYISNVRTLIEKVERAPWGVPTEHLELRLWVACKAHVLHWSNRRANRIERSYIVELPADREIRRLLDYSSGIVEDSDDSKLSDDEGRDAKVRPVIDHWNFALAFRILWDVVQSSRPSKALDHAWMLSASLLIKKLHAKAKQEIRASTALALSGIEASLPPELQETIFESVMEAEGVPLNVDVDVSGEDQRWGSLEPWTGPARRN